MTPEHWQQVKKVLAAALDQPAPERSAYLDQVCTDPLLRREVESLIAAQEGYSSFVEQTPAKRPALRSGTKLSHYEVLGPLGAGGMGEVYKAHDSRLARDVAIKVLPSVFVHDPERLARFQREARMLASLNHPNIAGIYGLEHSGDLHYLVMELVAGETLAERIKREGSLSVQESLKIAVQIAEALDAAHAKGIIHRDIKPANLFLTAGGSTKIGDFGLAKLASKGVSEAIGELGTEAATFSQLTMTGALLGTVAYMSPEQARCEEIDERSDIFSFGAVLYEMATGRQAFGGRPTAVVLHCILAEEPIRVRSLNPQIPEEFERIIAKALEKKRDARYQGMAELRTDLKNLERHEDSARVRGGLPAPHRFGVVENRPSALRKRRSREIHSLAVLPFVNEDQDPNTDYLTDGITETIIHALAEVPKLRIQARSSVFRFKSRTADPQSIGRELNVEAVLAGRLLQHGDVLRVSTELVDVRDGSCLWGARFDRSQSEIFAVQDEIATEISHKLQLHLSSEHKRRLVRRYTRDLEAYHLYLKGRYYWNKRTPEGITKAIGLFGEAISHDPGFALAYAGLADCFHPLGAYRVLSPKEAFGKAQAMALKALEIDDRIAEAHTSLAISILFYEGNWAKAQQCFERAIQLNPNYPISYQWYSVYLMVMGRQEQALAAMRHARELDPLSLPINTHLGWAFYFLRQFDQAEEQLRKTIELDRNFVLAHFVLAQVLTQQRRYDEAISELDLAQSQSPGLPSILSAVGYLSALVGDKSKALEIVAQLRDLQGKRYVSPFEFALVHMGMGEKSEALTYLEESAEDQSSWLIWIKIDPMFDVLRDEPRFAALALRLGFGG